LTTKVPGKFEGTPKQSVAGVEGLGNQSSNNLLPELRDLGKQDRNNLLPELSDLIKQTRINK
jgi:hypothetical protein